MVKNIYQKIAEKIDLGSSELIPKLFEIIANPDEAVLLMSMPGTPDDLAVEVKKSVTDVEEMYNILNRKGLAFKTVNGGTVEYTMCRTLIQFHYTTILWPDAPIAFYDLWQQFMEETWPDVTRLITETIPAILTNGKIDNRQCLLNTNSVYKITKKARNISAPNHYYALVEVDACSGCSLCTDRCRFNAIIVLNGKAIINNEKCLGCGLCSLICPEAAISEISADFINF